MNIGPNHAVDVYPVLVNSRFLRGKAASLERVTSPPWWAPYSVSILAGIFTGMLTRWPQIATHPSRIRKRAWMKTSEFILFGYQYKSLRAAWRESPSRAVRRGIIRSLRIARRRQLSYHETTAVALAAQVTQARLAAKGIFPPGQGERGDEHPHRGSVSPSDSSPGTVGPSNRRGGWWVPKCYSGQSHSTQSKGKARGPRTST